MLVVISPAKKLDFDNPCAWKSSGEPAHLDKTNVLAKELKKLDISKISQLMKLSQNLSELNYQRFQSFKSKYNTDLSKQAVFAFNGDTYTGLDIQSLDTKGLTYSKKHLRILSGLYGVLKPDDLIQPYRLEMGTKFSFLNYKNLYEYWKESVTKQVNEELKSNDYLVNCASNEYFKVIDKKKISKEIISPQFLDNKNGEYKMISFFAKKARGMMARYIIENKCKTLNELQGFDSSGYVFNKELTKNELEPVFTRDQ